MGILNLQKLTKRTGDKWIMRDLSLDVEEGRIFGIMGAPGCGKTVLLRIIAGLDKADSGSMSFDGNDLGTTHPAERGFGFISRESSLFPDQNAFENVAFGLREKGLGREEIIEKTNAMLLHLGLEDSARKKPDELSPDEAMLVSLGRALAVEPKLLVIDAPFAGFDNTVRENTLEKFRHYIKEAGITTIYAAQDHIEAFALCDQIGLMHNGEIIQTGAPREIYEHPENVFAASMLGRNNFFTARRISFTNSDIQEFQTQNGDHRLRTDKMDARRLGPITQDVTMSIRPENVVIAFGASFPEDNLVKAVVKDVRYQGATTRIVLDADGLILEALVLRLVGLNIFDECMVGLPPDRMLVLKD